MHLENMDKDNKAIAKEANEQVLKERNEQLLKIVKIAIRETLESIETIKKEKERVEDKLRILKKDLEDLRNGNFDKLLERQQKSPEARSVSINIENIIKNNFPDTWPRAVPTWPYGWTVSDITDQFYTDDWSKLTSGTYTTSNKSYYF